MGGLINNNESSLVNPSCCNSRQEFVLAAQEVVCSSAILVFQIA